mmetsp:Transcript_173303/g.555864  ORF Transcript_173303/g.555864 Transcript_173303/m.555864 type:complete len:204 (-) Transcript_173303:50-661(-)
METMLTMRMFALCGDLLCVLAWRPVDDDDAAAGQGRRLRQPTFLLAAQDRHANPTPTSILISPLPICTAPHAHSQRLAAESTLPEGGLQPLRGALPPVQRVAEDAKAAGCRQDVALAEGAISAFGEPVVDASRVVLVQTRQHAERLPNRKAFLADHASADVGRVPKLPAPAGGGQTRDGRGIEARGLPRELRWVSRRRRRRRC